MVVPNPQCDSQRLQSLLRDELSEQDESRLTHHVESCATCRTQLEEFAAERTWWQEASKRLRGGEWQSDGTLSLSMHDLHDLDSPNIGHSNSWIWSLDFLETSKNPTSLGRLGAYEMIEVIGSGGFGIVLKGYDQELNRHVAVKVLAPHLANNAAARKRFANEACAAAAVVHPHVVAIHTVAGIGKLPYLVMPFIAGESLQQRLDRQGSFDVKEVLRIGLQTAQGLAAAHAQGVVHRDIKPANILLEHGVDRVMLTDFGLARLMDDASLTRSTVIAGTPQYMSPEQARGDTIDHRTDLFSLGSVLYAMCVGHAPFRAETMLGILRRVNEESPRSIREQNASIPVWLANIIHRLLSKTADKRFQSAAEVADLLERCLAHVQQPTHVPLPQIPGSREPLTRRQRSMFAAVIVASVSLLCVLLYVTGGVWFGPAPEVPQKQDEVANQSQTSTKEPSSSPSPPSIQPPEPSLWNDGLDVELFDVDRRLEWLEWSNE